MNLDTAKFDDAVPDLNFFLVDKISRWHPLPLIWNDHERDLRCVSASDWLLSTNLSWRRERNLYLRICSNNHFSFKIVGFCSWFRFVSFTGHLEFIIHQFVFPPLLVISVGILRLFSRSCNCGLTPNRYAWQASRVRTWPRRGPTS